MNKKNKVLIIEDDSELLNLVAKAFEIEGFSALKAMTAKKALEFLKAEPVELIFADIALATEKTLDYLEDFSKLRPGVKIILTSGYPELSAMVKNEKNISFALKPYDIDKVINNSKNLLSK